MSIKVGHLAIANSSFRIFFLCYSKRVDDGSFPQSNCEQNCRLAVIFYFPQNLIPPDLEVIFFS